MINVDSTPVCSYRIMDVVLCDNVDTFMLKVSYALIMKNRKRIISACSMEDILELMTVTLPSKSTTH